MAASTFFVPTTISGGTAGVTTATDTGKAGVVIGSGTGAATVPTAGQLWPRGQGT